MLGNDSPVYPSPRHLIQRSAFWGEPLGAECIRKRGRTVRQHSPNTDAAGGDPNRHRQILILPPLPKAGHTTQCQDAWVGLGPRLQAEECGLHKNLFAQPPEPDIPQLHHLPESGPEPQHKPSAPRRVFAQGSTAEPTLIRKGFSL